MEFDLPPADFGLETHLRQMLKMGINSQKKDEEEEENAASNSEEKRK